MSGYVQVGICLGIVMLGLFMEGCWGAQPLETQATAGMLDLRGQDLEQVLLLKGDWRAHSGSDSLAFAAFAYDDTHWHARPAEGYFQQQGFPDEGLVWYRLHLRLPPDAPPLAGYIQHADNAHVLYAVRPGETPVVVAQSGYPAATQAETVLSRRSALFDLPQDTALVLAWKVANFGYRGGGPFFPIQIGAREVMLRARLWQNALVFVSLGFYLLVVCFFLPYWVRQRRDWPTLVVGLLALVMGVRAVTQSGLLEHLLPSLLTFRVRIVLEAVSVLVLPGLFGLLLWTFFPSLFLSIPLGRWKIAPPSLNGAAHAAQPLHPALRYLSTGAALLGTVFSLLVVPLALIAPPEVNAWLLVMLRLLMVLLLPLLVLVPLVAFQRRLPLSLGVFLGALLIAAGGTHDTLLAAGIIHDNTYLLSYTFLGFVLMQAFAVAHRILNTLETAVTTAEAASQSKSTFLSTVGHELRTPLTSILGFTRVLQDELKTGRPEHREFLHHIRNSGEHLLELINNLLDSARIEAGQLELHPEQVELRPFIDEVVALVQPQLNQKGLTLSLDCAGATSHLHADPVRLRQVLLNLLSNAIKFTEYGTITLRGHPTTLHGKPACALEVRDTGTGMAPAFLAELFVPFSQEGRTHEKGGLGTGLGLSITRHLVERMNGTIRVESKLNAGSTFTVILPSSASEATPRRLTLER
jgi:signal transduction histidine kinase